MMRLAALACVWSLLGGCNADAEEPAMPTPTTAVPTPPPAASDPAPTHSPAGCWDAVIELPWPAGETPGELCLDNEAEQWTGRFFLQGEWRTLDMLEIAAAGLDFSIDTPVGRAAFELEYDGPSLRGTATGKFGPRPFRATRKTPTQLEGP